MKPFGEWGPWTDLDRPARGVAAQVSYTDGLEVFVIGMNDEVFHKWCDRIDWPWTAWRLLDHESSPNPLAPDGSLPVLPAG